MKKEEGLKVHRISEMLNTGWWEADLRNRKFHFSESIQAIMECDERVIGFTQYSRMVREDYRSRVAETLWASKENYSDQLNYPIYVGKKTKWLSVRFIRENEDKVVGLMHEIDRIDSNPEQSAKETMKNLLHQMYGISLSLYSFLQSENLDDTINKILQSLVTYYSAERAYIFEYNWDEQNQSCTYEAVSRPGLEEIQNLQKMFFEPDTWWNTQILERRPILLSTLDDLPDWDIVDREVLEAQHIQSLMVVPFTAKDGTIWGYAGIDLVDNQRDWSDEDFQWFSSLMHIINICFELGKSKAQIQHDKEFLNTIYDNLPVGMEMYDANGLFVQANDKVVEILGVDSTDDYKGKNIFNHPALPADVKRRMRKGEKTDFNLSYDMRLLSEYYGKEFPNEQRNLTVKIVPIFDTQHEIQNYLVIVINNTETTNAYLRIQEFEDYFSLIANLAKVGYFKWNLSNKEGFGISQWFINLDKPADSVMTDELEEIYENVHAEDFKAIKQFYEQAAAGEFVSFEKELRVTSKEGDVKWLRCTMTVKESATDASRELYGVSYDITELKETILAKNKAEALDKLKSAFLANMSHEIRTPLNSIIGFSDLLAESNDEAERKEFITIIQRNNELLLKLVSDILDLSKIESGTFNLIRKDTSVRGLSLEVVRSFGNRDNTEQVALLFDDTLPDIRMYIDEDRVKQILMNFITNAFKFTKEGHVKLGYQKQTDNFVKFYVEDTGSGISPEDKERVFDRFVKLNSFVQGTGLGLSICRSLVEQMGGQIGVESEVDKGSCFWFTLPLNQ